MSIFKFYNQLRITTPDQIYQEMNSVGSNHRSQYRQHDQID